MSVFQLRFKHLSTLLTTNTVTKIQLLSRDQQVLGLEKTRLIRITKLDTVLYLFVEISQANFLINPSKIEFKCLNFLSLFQKNNLHKIILPKRCSQYLRLTNFRLSGWLQHNTKHHVPCCRTITKQ